MELLQNQNLPASGRSQYRQIAFWMLSLLVGGLLADYMVLAKTAADNLEYVSFFELGAQMIFNFLSFWSACAVLWLVARTIVVGCPTKHWNLIYAIIVIALIALLDWLVSSQIFSKHWSLPFIRVAALVSAIFLCVGFVWKPNRYILNSVWVRAALAILLLAVCFATFAIGTSWHPFTPKYLREPTAALIQYLFILFGVALVLCVAPKKKFRAGKQVGAIGILVVLFLGSTTIASVLSAKSAYVVATNLEVTRAIRNWNRRVVESCPGLKMLGFERYAGQRWSPQNKPETRTRIGECAQKYQGDARSALLISIDALRADYFGVSPTSLPGIQRLREQSIEHMRAFQPTSGTLGTMYGLHYGRYTNTAKPSAHVWQQLHDDLGYESEILQQAYEEPNVEFTNTLLDRLRSHKKSNAPFIIHAHYLSLHIARGMARLTHDYPDQLKKIDVEINRILDALESYGLANETVLFLTADHGEELLEERGYVSHGYGVTNTLLNTPLLMRVPQGVAGASYDVVSGVDIAPTILAALGVECEQKFHGRSLLGQTSLNRIVYGRSMGPNATFGKPRLMYSDIHTVISWPWKLVYNRGDNAIALYDIESDYQEKNNIADTRVEKAWELYEELQRFLVGEIPEYEVEYGEVGQRADPPRSR